MNGPDCSGYYPDIAQDLEDGMVITLSMWGSDYGTMSWLDGDTGCQGGCWNQPTVYISDLKVTTGGRSENENKEESWEDETNGYEFGTACKSLVDDDCKHAKDCKACHWSWPVNDEKFWLSK